jgi:eukaryotic-like serine/threonine-protein kinase
VYAALAAMPPATRPTALAQLCAGDDALRGQVEELLAAVSGPQLVDRSAGERPSVVGMVHRVEVGTHIGAFRIESLLGVGGMGEVYRARDTKLNRDVAIKILPASFAADAERLARFKREAQVLASLNHPHVGAIYGFEDSGDVHALVLELVEGPTLADRLTRGRLPLDEALAIARQIAEALEAAHEQGIVHRDLKPVNIKVREDGTVKVLDFGLAKIAESGVAGPASVAAQRTQSPTITTPAMTAAGIILGTAAYMSPEQAKGKPADKRSDIWAFGCVLYELLAGRRAFEGEDVSDTLASILRSEPDWSRLPADTPASVRRLLHRALAKEKSQRTGDAVSLRLDLDDAASHITDDRRRGGRRGGVIAAVVTLILTAVAATAGWIAWRRTPAIAAELRVDIATPDTSEPTSVALSPDGTKLVYVLDNGGRSRMVLRELASGTIRALPGTGGAMMPFWAPNSRSIAFFAEGHLRRIDLAGGPARDIAAAPGGRNGGSWGAKGTIVFVPAGAGTDMLRVNENGGAATPIVQMFEKDRLVPRGPNFLPDGTHFVFYAAGRGVFAGSLDGTPPRLLTDADTNGLVVRDHLLFQRGETLFAQAFDGNRLELRGEAFQIADPVNSAFNGLSSISASRDGTIAFRSGIGGDRRELAWFDRSGRKLEALGDADGSRISSPNLSHDGRRVAAGRIVNRRAQVWVFDLSRRGWSRLTSDGSSQPVWSPDDRQLAFISTRLRSADVFARSSQPGGEERPLVESESLKGTTDWSNDGRYLLYSVTPLGSPQEIWAYSFDEKKPFAVVNEPGVEQTDAKFSPDGKWIAYQSNTSGRVEVYLQPFRVPGERILISNAGGAQARWRADSRELYYIDFESRLNAVSVALPTKAGRPELGRPVPLFQVRLPGDVLQPGGAHQQYDVASDGQRFLVNTLAPDPTPSPITLIVNWHPADERTR